MQEDEPSTFVTYERFEKKMLEVLFTNEYEPDTDEMLLSAFRVRPRSTSPVIRPGRVLTPNVDVARPSTRSRRGLLSRM
jgi:hypothetical protein